MFSQTWRKITASAGCGYRREQRFKVGFPPARAVDERKERMLSNRFPTSKSSD
jgi:hypothetical protein